VIGYGWSGALAQCDLASAWARTWAFLARVLRAMRLLLGDATLPRWLRIGLAACLLPILGPFDEIALVILAAGGTDVAVTKNPRQDVQHAHLHAFYAERDRTENYESSAHEGHPVIGAGHRAFSAALSSDAVKVESDSTRLAADISVAAQPWGGSYCSYQLGVDGPFWVTPALGPSMDEFNRRLARADGLKAEPDPKLGGAINLVRPSLADAQRLHVVQRATAEQRASFETFAAQVSPDITAASSRLHPPGSSRSQRDPESGS